MAPEIYQVQEYDGRKIDIWSAGVTLLVCLYGEYPWAAPTRIPSEGVCRYVGGCRCRPPTCALRGHGVSIVGLPGPPRENLIGCVHMEGVLIVCCASTAVETRSNSTL